MRSRRALAALACLAAIAVVVVLLPPGDDAPPPRSTLEPAPARVPTTPRDAPRRAPQAELPPGPVGARVVRRTQLRRSPGGAVVRAIGTTTGYGSERVLAVVARRGRWLGVLTDHMPNSRAAWIPIDSAELLHEPYRLDVDLSARRILVRREGRVVRRIPIAIGKPSTSTPVGRFAVTDALRIVKSNGAYGCCAVALTARQPNLPQGWTTSDRIAIHGTPNEGAIGGAVSNGCLHARKVDMRWLLRRVTLGAEVRVQA